MMHTNNWRLLNASDAKSYEKVNIIYIFLVTPYGLAGFHVDESHCPGTTTKCVLVCQVISLDFE